MPGKNERQDPVRPDLGCPFSPNKGRQGSSHAFRDLISPISGRMYIYCSNCGTSARIQEAPPEMPVPSETITGEEPESIPAEDPSDPSEPSAS